MSPKNKRSSVASEKPKTPKILVAQGDAELIGSTEQFLKRANQFIEEQKQEPLLPKKVHKRAVTIGGKRLSYQVMSGYLPLYESEGKKRGEMKAKIFYIAYSLDGQDSSKRPVTFTFNGGPGSSSVWLHLGAFGPRKVCLSEEGFSPPPPYMLTDNPESILDITDLVFIDPVSTGFSRVEKTIEEKEYHSFTGDIHSIGEFIYRFLTQFKRWDSPKFIAGESYGTTRGAALVNYLQETHGVYFNGIILISIALDLSTLFFDKSLTILPYLLILPSYAATAWYHKKLSPPYQKMPLPRLIAEVRKFASEDYLLALFSGNKIAPEQKMAVIKKLCNFTGLSPETIAELKHKIGLEDFAKRLLKDEQRWVGRLDSRFKTPEDQGSSAQYDADYNDPSLYELMGVFTGCLNTYLRQELEFESTDFYELLSFKTYKNWKWDQSENQYCNVTQELQKAVQKNSHLKVFVGSGYYDLATPWFATEYTFDQLEIPPSLSSNFSYRNYEAGHMMYIHADSRKKLKKDLAEFYAKALSPSES
jgi:carboxypeptidase C (cathepsin A)